MNKSSSCRLGNKEKKRKRKTKREKQEDRESESDWIMKMEAKY